MAVTTLSPGVYIEEIQKLPASIAPVATAIPAFVGYTEKAIIEGVPWVFVGTEPAPAVRITSLLEYEEFFGGPDEDAFDIAISDTYNDDNQPISRELSISFKSGSPSIFMTYYSVKHFFANGGSTCYIVSVDDAYSVGNINTDKMEAGINSLEKYDEPTLVLFPDAVSDGNTADYASIYNTALQHCAKMQDRFAIGDVYGNDLSYGAVQTFRDALSLDNLKYGAVYAPFLNTLISRAISNSESEIVSYTATGGTTSGDPYFVTDNPVPIDLDVLISDPYPSLYNSIIGKIQAEFYVTLPASPAMAGIYATIDRTRGVWKAPANVGIQQISGPTVAISNAIQDYLNVDATSGKSINAIRSFTGRGTIVWGARTLAGNDNEWRYVNVRRLFLFAEESIEKATEFVVFEPNTANTWQRVRGMIEAFLTSLWRDGALAGATTEEAFFVRVGLGTTMTAQDILEGKMIVEVGLAAVRPAEFIVLQFSHKLQES